MRVATIGEAGIAEVEAGIAEVEVDDFVELEPQAATDAATTAATAMSRTNLDVPVMEFTVLLPTADEHLPVRIVTSGNDRYRELAQNVPCGWATDTPDGVTSSRGGGSIPKFSRPCWRDRSRSPSGRRIRRSAVASAA